jgi:beta-glucanase (GH16 family)
LKALLIIFSGPSLQVLQAVFMAIRKFVLPPLGCCFTLLVGSSLLFGGAWVVRAGVKAQTASHWKLSWQDEFDQPDGTRPDPTKWTYSLGGGGWGNHELESYTNRVENARVEKGNLVITARRETFTGKDGIAREYTSARMKTQGLFAQKYGRFEARIRIPQGQGIWPAFWMMGDDLFTAGWPKCGEIDVMENIGKEPGVVHGSLHGPLAGPAPSAALANGEEDRVKRATDLTAAFRLPEELRFADGFHVYAVDWQPEAVRYYVDDSQFAAFSPQSPGGGPWVFDHPFFILLNVAVGGKWPGDPDETTKFPQSMLVDYVRVYTAH